ncbi:MAG: hypothetical protein L6Q54_07885 [Leptospiraceae bacterium]|nr:hypothetical protein [Leptospiraceae bacterium]MCK6381154.1 hypothetical protein [Leptospiraceae bacterium]
MNKNLLIAIPFFISLNPIFSNSYSAQVLTNSPISFTVQYSDEEEYEGEDEEGGEEEQENEEEESS